MVSAVVKRPTPPGTSRLTEGIGAMHVIKALQACHVPINLDLVTEQRSGSQPWVSQVSRGLMDGVEASGGRGQGEPHPPTPTPPLDSQRQAGNPACKRPGEPWVLSPHPRWNAARPPAPSSSPGPRAGSKL